MRLRDSMSNAAQKIYFGQGSMASPEFGPFFTVFMPAASHIRALYYAPRYADSAQSCNELIIIDYQGRLGLGSDRQQRA